MAKRTTIFAAVFAAALSFALSVQAEDYNYYWKGGSGDYFTQSKWQLSDGSDAPVPLSSANDAISTFVQADGSTVNFDYSHLGDGVKSLTIGGDNGTVSVTRSSGNTLTIAPNKFISVLDKGTLNVKNTMFINADGSLSVNGGSLSTTGIDISGTFSYTSGNNFVNANTINLYDGGTLNIAGGGQFRINGATAALNIEGGTATVDSISYIGVGANGVINQSGGTATFNNTLAFGWGNGDGTYNLSGGTLTTEANVGLWCSKSQGFNTFNMTGGTANFNKAGNSFAVGLYDDGTGTQWTPQSVANVFNLYSGTVNAADTFAIQYGGTLNVAKNGETGGDGVLNAKAITISNGGNLNISSGTVNVGEGGTTISGGTLKLSGSGKLASSVIDVETGSTLTYYNTTPQNTSPLTFNVNGGTLEFYNDRTTSVTHADNNAICTGAAGGDVTINGTGGTLLIDGGGHVGVLNGKNSTVTISMDKNSTIYVKDGYFMNGGYTMQNWSNNQAELKIGSTGIVNLWDGQQMKVGGLTGEAGAQMIDTQSAGQGISVGNGVTSDQSFTYNGTINLSGKNFEYVGAGKQTLNGDITNAKMYSKGGTLILGTAGNDMKINTGVLIKEDGGEVQVDGNLIVESDIFRASGTWSTGNGTITLKSGSQMRVGGTMGPTIGVKLDGGLLFNDGDNGGKDATVSSPITVLSDSQLQSGWSGSLTLTGALSGSGGLTVNNDSGITYFKGTGSGNYTGSLTITGNVRIGNSNSASVDASTYIGKGEIILKSVSSSRGIFMNNDNHLTFANNLNVSQDSYLQAGWSKSMTFTGNIKGAGRLEVLCDSGWVIMATKCTDNAFKGDVQVNYDGSENNKRAKMRLAADQPFGANAGEGKFYGDLDMNGYSQIFKGLYNNGDKGSIYNNTQNLSTLTLDTTGKDLTFQSSITGNIALVIKGTGKQTLSKVVAYTGSTTIESGTLALTASSGTNKLYDLSGAGNLNFGAADLQLNNTTDTVFSGKLTGTGKITVGSNTHSAWIELGSTNDFTGGIQINHDSKTVEGKVRLGADNALGTANRAYIYGTIDMNGYDQSFAGLSNDGDKGSIFNETDTLSTLTIDTTSLTASSQFHSSIKGNIALVLTGTGIMTLTKAPEYTGSTTVESGTLVLQATENTLYNLSGEGVVSYGANALTLSNSDNTTFSGDILGSGAITKTGNGTLTLSKEPGYSGATVVESGTLALSEGGTLYNLSGGSVDENGEMDVAANLDATGKDLKFVNTETTKYVGAIKAASIEKSGDGTLQIYSSAEKQVDAGHFLISSGRLDMKDYYKGSMEVKSGATLSPGNSIGKLTIDGTLYLNGGTLLMEVEGAESDQLIVTNGSLNFGEGGTIVLDFVNGMSPNEEFAVVIDAPNSNEDWVKYVDAYYFTNLNYEFNDAVGYWVLSGKVDPNAVPEPSTWALLILSVAGLMYWRKRKN